MIALRPYQQEAIKAVADGYRRGIRRPLIGLPTGTGKTVVFSSITSSAVAKGRSVLILAHRDELLEQARDKLLSVDPSLELSVGMVKAAKDDYDRPVCIASIQTLAGARRLARAAQHGRDVVIVDEAHHAAADSYQRVLDGFGCLDETGSGPLTIGVTATPQRADSKDLGDTWQEIVYHRDMLSMIREGYLVDLRGVQVKLRELDVSSLKVRRGEFAADEAGEALSAAEAPLHAVRAWHEHAAGRSTLVFTPTVALAHEMAAEFTKAGVPAAALSGNTPMDERRSILERLSTGELLVVANAQVLTEGFDEPRVSCIIVARPTRSQPLYVQMVGRGTRLHPGKTDCLILDLVGVTDRMDLTTLPRLFGLSEDEAAAASDAIAEDGIVSALSSAPALAQRRQGELVAKQVELFSRRDFNWTRAGDGLWVLDYGAECVTLEAERDSGRWRVVQYRRTPKGQQAAAPDVIQTGVDLSMAMGVAEEHARSSSAFSGNLVSRAAAWRQNPATPGQLATLRRFRISPWNGISAGEASDLITQQVATFRARRA